MSSEPIPRQFVGDISGTLRNCIESNVQRAMVCCPNCEHFDRRNEKCGLNGKRPPANVVAFGCECFKHDDIPF